MEVAVRILSVQASNFASYDLLDFQLMDRGLILIQGPTGSGKSTLCDLVPWCLFGITAKNGSVDEVLSWPGDKVTRAEVNISYCDHLITIVRVRGPKAKDNDLYIQYGSTSPGRGKDLNDTQKIINNLLGVDANLYLSGSYFHEFSTTAQFFITTAKNRRLICEQIVDLSLAKRLQLKLSETKKTLSKMIETAERDAVYLGSKLEQLEKTYQVQQNLVKNWEINLAKKRLTLETAYDNFEKNRASQILTMQNQPSKASNCPTCGTTLNNTEHAHANKNLISQVLERTNPYLDQLAALETEICPNSDVLEDIKAEKEAGHKELDALLDTSEKLAVELSDLETLEEVTDSYRAVTIQNAIGFIESSTNDLLNSYFDGEINVQFETDSSDKIEVIITKDGNQCSYTQLSKGQRQLLKLCFGISIMKAVSNHSGVTFNQIFLDEALDGLDDNLKVKAYQLLESLSLDYESVFVVEHNSALKEMFPNKLLVQLVNGHSEINEE